MRDEQERRIERVEEAERKEAASKESQLAAHSREQEAVRNTFVWVTRYTRTYNEHWLDEGRPSPYEPFPPHLYFKDIFDIFDLERVTWIEKSRDLMVSWACVAYLTLNAMKVPRRGVLFQTQTHEKARQLVNLQWRLIRSSDLEIRISRLEQARAQSRDSCSSLPATVQSPKQSAADRHDGFDDESVPGNDGFDSSN